MGDWESIRSELRKSRHQAVKDREIPLKKEDVRSWNATAAILSSAGIIDLVKGLPVVEMQKDLLYNHFTGDPLMDKTINASFLGLAAGFSGFMAKELDFGKDDIVVSTEYENRYIFDRDHDLGSIIDRADIVGLTVEKNGYGAIIDSALSKIGADLSKEVEPQKAAEAYHSFLDHHDPKSTEVHVQEVKLNPKSLEITLEGDLDTLNIETYYRDEDLYDTITKYVEHFGSEKRVPKKAPAI